MKWRNAEARDRRFASGGTPLFTAEALERRTLLAAVTFTAGGGSWTTPSNWSTNSVPGPDDDVIIPARRSVYIGGRIPDPRPDRLYGTYVSARSVTTASDLIISGGGLTLTHGLTLSDNATVSVAGIVYYDIPGGFGTVYGGLGFTGEASQSLSGRGRLVVSNPSSNVSFTSSLTAPPFVIGPDIKVIGDGGSISGIFINQGLISGATTNSQFDIRGAITNDGTIGVTGKLGLDIGRFNPGTGKLVAQSPGTTISFFNYSSDSGSSFTQASLGILVGATDSPHFVVNYGTLTGGLVLDATTGSWAFMGGTMKGGTYSATGGASLQVSNFVGPNGPVAVTSTFDDVTLASDVLVNRDTTLAITNDLQLQDNAKIHLRGSTLRLDAGSQRFVGEGEILCEAANGVASNVLFNTNASAGTTIVTEPGVTLRTNGGDGVIGDDASSGTITFEGLVAASKGTLTLRGKIVSRGTLRVETGGAIDLLAKYSGSGRFDVRGGTLKLSGTFNQPDIARFDRSVGQVIVTGTIAGGLALSPATGSWDFNGGSLLGGIYTTVGGAALRAIGPNGARLDDVVIASDLYAVDGSVTVVNDLTFANNAKLILNTASLNVGSGATLAGHGEVALAPGAIRVSGTSPSLTIDPGVTIRILSGNSALGASDTSILNQGVISVEAAAATLGFQGRFTNQGVVRVTAGTLRLDRPNGGSGALDVQGGTLVLGGIFTQAGLGNLRRTGGDVNIVGSLTDGLTLDASTGAWNLAGGRLVGGTYRASGGAKLSVTAESRLDGVTVAGDLDIAGSVAGVTGGLTLADGATIRLIGANASLDFRDGDQTLNGQGEVRFEGGTMRPVRYLSNFASSLTIGPSVTLRTDGGDGTVGGGGQLTSVVNAGVVIAEAAGSSITFKDALSNIGMVLSSNGASLAATGPFDNSGVLTLGPGATFTADGPFSTTGVINFQIGGSSESGQFGSIRANRNFAFGGTANVELVNDYHPVAGEVYPLVQFGSATGSFSTVSGLVVKDTITLFTLTATPTTFGVTATGESPQTSAHVSGVFIAGSGWKPDFFQALVSEGLSDSTLGYRLGNGGVLAYLPWTNLDRISIQFDQDVNLDADDLSVIGVRAGTVQVASVAFSTSTHTATWTLARPLTADAMLLVLNAQVGGVNSVDGGRLLDGENLGQSFSGDGIDGGDFRLRLNVLPGDVNQSGAVGASDLVLTRNRLGRRIAPGSTTPSGYPLLSDLDGNGFIGASDLVLVRNRVGSALPTVADFAYANFSSTAGLELFSDTATAGGVLRIVPASERRSGAVRRQGVEDLSLGFTTSFAFRYANVGGILDDSGNHGTDGIAFTIQPSGSGQPVLAGTGLSVWFDAYRDGAEPSSSRVGIYRNGGLLAQFDVEALGIRFREGGPHTAQIDYSGSSLSIQLDGQLVGRIAINLGSMGLVGFAGFSGQAYADQQLLSWSFRPTALPGSAALFASQTLLRFAPYRREALSEALETVLNAQ